MVATLLLAFIIFSVSLITGNSLNTKERVVAEDREYMNILTAFSRINRDVEHLYSPLYFSRRFVAGPNNQEDAKLAQQLKAKYSNNENFAFANRQGLPVPVFKDEEPGQLTFFTLANRRKIENSKQSRLAWVTYRLEENDTDDQTKQGLFKLMREQASENIYATDDKLFDEPKSFPLLDNVVSMEFEFWDRKTKKWVEKLKDAALGENLIRGVKVLLTWKDNEEGEHKEERIFRPLYPYFVPEDPNKPETGATQLPN